ncbi:MAG: septum site-determining protein Ssd, partial [Frankiaceae bacterium]
MPGPAEREPRPGGGPAERAQARSLLLTDDPVLLDDLLRLSAAAGVEVEVAAEPGRARVAWSRAPLVLVGADVAAACAEGGLPRRQRVVLVGADLDDAGVWQRAVRLGAEHVVFLPDAEPWLITALTDAIEPDARPGRLLAVVGGRGGAGATTLAVALAFAGARSGYRTTLIDVDP